MDENKEVLIHAVTEWIKFDNEINQLKKELKEKNNQKKQFTQKLLNVMKTKNIDCLSIKNGNSIVYSSKTVKKPINKKMLTNLINSYYCNSTNPNEAQTVLTHILENRDTCIKESIVKKNN